MEKFVIRGGKPLIGTVTAAGAKNVALKVLVAACLTDEEVIIHNVPHISDFRVMVEIMEELGGIVTVKNHSVRIQMKHIKHSSIPLDKAALARTSSMFIAPLLLRMGEAIIPNPGGCRLGARPIDRVIDGLRNMGADITYMSEDGYFHAKAPNGLTAVTYEFEKTTHTGTETMIIAAVLAKGKTVLKNVALEPEIDDLINLLNSMGAKITRGQNRVIEIEGVKKLHGTEFTISPDRNEIVTFAIAALVTKGDILVKNAKLEDLSVFLQKIEEIGGGIEINGGVRFFYKGPLKATDIVTVPYPGFMTDWQALWAVLMTQAEGVSTLHETVFENKFGYVRDLRQMGAKAVLFNPPVENPETVYNFNLADDSPAYSHAVRITGPKVLHNAVVTMLDIRAGAAVVIAALAAKGTSTIYGIEKLDRGYEQLDVRFNSLGAQIKRVKDSQTT